MKREIIQTADGSTTIYLPDWNENYHSKHGAIQEANHVFIQNGLVLFAGKPISILEIGFGTGLNAFITFLEAAKLQIQVDYIGVEAYPVSEAEIASMNYVNELNASQQSVVFEKMHASPWNEKWSLTDTFSLTKRKQFIDQIDDVLAFDLIYFDAFGFRVQPELWRTEIFCKMFKAMKNNGVLVTYAARGEVRRSMIEVGFSVEKLPGPPGKREMLRATKKL
ncbi:tRNA (5-methylaminomethyl-2-thiouridine)(34)-methyltransferase MnmD [Flavobacterium sp. CYK-4]|uniref:tRNA (5-methylaminomethyl-2-thiouridine)(34)-methyltransferase MnmD n=1 Tax=Flavobacterium lotistagni TaxID=2709660 RepID=UPI00140A7A51|nr:tRNA (5-methylaminomethyl-2-thiouridine)(34)-methyltransferase MnmD [Flavobacterium lotistagni]NHM07051.1 tRNA (5-methylaminomethyl-2-thiouridine)(34)-methyltransferase MnmD [Flavobacterium lotistagni]